MFVFPLDNGFLQQNKNDRLSAGNGNAAHDGTIWKNDPKHSLLGNFTSEASSDNFIERTRAGKSLLLQNRRKRKRALENHRRVNKNFISLLPLFLGRIFWLLLTKGLCSTMSKKTQKTSHSHDQDETEVSQLGIRDAWREKAVGASCRRPAAWLSRNIVLSGWNDTFLQWQITSWLLGLAAGFSGCYSNGAGLWVPTDAHRWL